MIMNRKEAQNHIAQAAHHMKQVAKYCNENHIEFREYPEDLPTIDVVADGIKEMVLPELDRVDLLESLYGFHIMIDVRYANENIKHLLNKGCRGYDNMSDEELEDELQAEVDYRRYYL